MSKNTDHPSDEQLSAFALGHLPAVVAKEVEEHISACDSCCETMINLSDDDTFVDLVQRVGSTESGLGKDNQDSIPMPLQQHPVTSAKKSSAEVVWAEFTRHGIA